MSQASIAHEAPLDVLRRAPSTVLELLRAFGVDFGATATVESVDVDLTETIPSSRRADFVALVRRDNGTPAAAVIVEVQLAVDADKLKAWPHYITHVQSRHDVPTTLVVLAPHRAVAQWAARLPAYSPNLVLSPFVIGPDAIVRLLEESGASLTSPLALLAALADFAEADAHKRPRLPDPTSIGMRVFEALVRSERSEQQFLGLSFLQGAAPERFHAKLKKILEAAGMDVRQLIHDKGKAEGKADAILKVLASRNLSPPETQRRRIREERDLELLDRWLENALTATVHGDVFR